MAEIVGLIASIFTLAEAGAKVATTLGQLSVQLKNAGKDANEVSKKIRLVSKALKKIEAKLKDGGSAIDVSLVEDYILVCEDRMAEANRLVEKLEKEMNSSRMWDRTKFHIRFLLEKSTFSLLQQDMDSLHITLNLYVTTLTFQQVGANETKLDDIREKLVELKQEVERDLMFRSAGSTIHAAFLSIQYNNYFYTGSQAPSQSANDGLVVEEIDSDDGKDGSQSADESSDRALSLLMSRSDIGSMRNDQSIPLDVLEDETVSKALVVFTQLQMVQRKTLRRATSAFDGGQQSNTPPLSRPVIIEDNLTEGQDAADGSDHLHSGIDNTTASNLRSSSYVHRSSRRISSNIAKTPDRPQPLSSPETLPIPNQRYELDDSAITNEAEELFSQRLRMATLFRDNYFYIENCRTGKRVQIYFTDLRTWSFPDIVIDMHKSSLTYDPPRPGVQKDMKDATEYQPPPRPALLFSTDTAMVQSDKKFGNKVMKILGSSDDQRKKSELEAKLKWEHHQKQVLAFVDYVEAYARWYTDTCKSIALKNLEYHIRFSPTTGESFVLDKPNDFPGDGLRYKLYPNGIAELEFTSRQLIPANMIYYKFAGQDARTPLVDEGPYSQDLGHAEDLFDQMQRRKLGRHTIWNTYPTM